MEGEDEDWRQAKGGIIHKYRRCRQLLVIFSIKWVLIKISTYTPQLFAGRIHPALFSFAVEVTPNAFRIYQCDRHSMLVCFTQRGKLITHLL